MLTRLMFIMMTIFVTNSTTAQELTKDEQAVKALEEDYWTYVERNDVESYLKLWDDRFIGWPENSVTTAEVDTIADWIPELHKEVLRPDFKIIWHAVRVFGDTVVTHYHFTFSGIDPNTNEEFFIEDEIQKITHTWKRDGDTWRIITGMSGDYPPANAQ